MPINSTENQPAPQTDVQPVSPLPVDNTIQPHEAKQKNFWRLATIVFGALFLVSIGSFYYLDVKVNEISKDKEEASKKPTDTVTTVKTATPMPTATPVSQTPVTTPQKDTVYYGTHNGYPTLYLSSDSTIVNADALNGYAYIHNLGGDRTSYTVDFTDLKNPVELLEKPSEFSTLEWISGFDIDPGLNTIFLSVVLTQQTPSLAEYNRLYKINLTSRTNELLWENNMMGGNSKYGKYGGATEISDVINSQYIVLNITPCYRCGGGPTAGTLILNAKTKAEKYMGEIGNITFMPDKNQFTYQKLAPFQESCGPEGGMGCDENNMLTVYKPSGEVLTDTLP